MDDKNIGQTWSWEERKSFRGKGLKEKKNLHKKRLGKEGRAWTMLSGRWAGKWVSVLNVCSPQQQNQQRSTGVCWKGRREEAMERNR